jgi:hypothetical protein
MQSLCRVVFVSISMAILMGAISYAGEVPPPLKLPQAAPGTLYNAQLAIPAGLGYPFTCSLAGDSLPKGLTFECARLLFKGRVPMVPEKNYTLTLEISDGGSKQEYSLVLPISAQPIRVNLATQTVPSEATAQTEPTKARQGPAAQPMPVNLATKTGPPEATAQTEPTNAQHARSAEAPVSANGPGADDLPGGGPPADRAPVNSKSDTAAAATVELPKAAALDLKLVFSLKPENQLSSAGATECDPITLQVTTTDTTGAQHKPSGTALVNVTDTVDKKTPAIQLKVDIDEKGQGYTELPMLAPGTYNLTAVLDGSNDYYDENHANPIPTTLIVNKAVQPSYTCPYRMPPVLSAVAGLNVEGASSTAPAATFLGILAVDLPLFPARQFPNRLQHIDEARFLVGGSTRIAGMAQPGQLSAASLTTGYLATAVNSTPDKIVQSWEGTGSLSWKILSSNVGIGSFDNGQPTSSTYPRSTTNQIQTAYPNPEPNVTWPLTCSYGPTSTATPPATSPSCYIAFIPADRQRFYRHYEAGFRFRLYGEDFDHHILRFPGIIDLTVGQNEYVTGGSFNGVVVHLGGSLPIPLPKLDGVYAFGYMDSAINGPVGGGAQLLLEPVPSTANVTYLSNTVYDITVPQPNRDRYRFGFGIDLYHLLSANAQKTK